MGQSRQTGYRSFLAAMCVHKETTSPHHATGDETPYQQQPECAERESQAIETRLKMPHPPARFCQPFQPVFNTAMA